VQFIQSPLRLNPEVLRCVYSKTTFIRAITSLSLQIRQVAHLRSGDMQPARFKLHAEEHTSNPVQRPNFRGGGAKGEQGNE
jgi:hypothetical protein